MVIISSYYEQTYIFIFKYIFVFRHILPCLINKSVVSVHLYAISIKYHDNSIFSCAY